MPDGGALRLRDLLYPRRCPFCDRPVRPQGALVCAGCTGAARPIDAERDALCMRCGRILADPGREYCADCAKVRHFYRRGAAAFPYARIRMPVYRFKFGGRREYADYFAAMMARAMEERFAPCEVTMLVPVPLSAKRLRERGYNQAALLARGVAEMAGIPVREDVLRRVRDTGALRKMGVSERQHILENAFIASANDVKSELIMLVDDIYTTGATIDACAKTLLDAGAGGVCFLTLAIGEDRDDQQGTRQADDAARHI